MKKLGPLTIILLVLASSSFAQSAADLKRASELFKTGVAKFQARQYEAAISDFSAYLAIRKDFYGVWYNRGVANYELGNYALAIEDLNQAIKLKPGHVDSWDSRGDCYLKLMWSDGQKYAPLAVGDFSQVLLLDPRSAKAYRKRGLAHTKLEQDAYALSDLTNAIRLDAKSAESYFRRGFVYFRAKRMNLAKADFEKAYALEPEYPDVKLWLDAAKRDIVGQTSAQNPPAGPQPSAKATPSPADRPAVRKMTELEIRQEMLSLVKLTEDSNLYAERLIPIFEGAGADPAKQRALQPFVIGYFGWKAKAIIRQDVGKFSAPPLLICRILIGLYDKDADDTFAAIIGRARGVSGDTFSAMLNGSKVTEQEKAAIHKLVFTKYGLGYGSGDDGIEANEAYRWRYNIAMAMGEMSGQIANWYKVPTWNKQHEDIAAALFGLEQALAKAPPGTPRVFIEKVRKLSAHGDKAYFSEADRKELALALRDALFSSLAFAGMDSSSPTSVMR